MDISFHKKSLSDSHNAMMFTVIDMSRRKQPAKKKEEPEEEDGEEEAEAEEASEEKWKRRSGSALNMNC